MNVYYVRWFVFTILEFFNIASRNHQNTTYSHNIITWWWQALVPLLFEISINKSSPLRHSKSPTGINGPAVTNVVFYNNHRCYRIFLFYTVEPDTRRIKRITALGKYAHNSVYLYSLWPFDVHNNDGRPTNVRRTVFKV